jgi:prepilin-type N-terminal cleavage/methylation domain-containing protein
MKKTNKGFTIVELIIVIAVIGILAAILIPAFSNIIEKANAKSAYSDARGALSTYLANTSTDDEGVTVKEGTIFVVEKAKKLHVFKFESNQLVVDGEPIDMGDDFDVTDDTTYPAGLTAKLGTNDLVEREIDHDEDPDTALVANPVMNLIPTSVHIFVPAP